MISTAITQLETTIVAQAGRQAGRRLSSAEIGAALVQTIVQRANAGDRGRILPLLMRLAIKADPYAPSVEALLADHATVLRDWAAQSVPAVLDTIRICGTLNLPVPVIVSCGKYLAKAREARAAVKERYFDIEPIVVRGDSESLEETFVDAVLCLPVDDSYEGLPAKVFEAFALLDALGAESGILKLDDDLRLLPGEPLDRAGLQATFGAADYIGYALASARHDRSWHFGKCLSPVPAVYGKPFRAPWARGALYFVSGRALRVLSRQFLRFPGCIAGELYEDKAVGDVLHEAGVVLAHHPLELRLGIATDAPERALDAA